MKIKCEYYNSEKVYTRHKGVLNYETMKQEHPDCDNVTYVIQLMGGVVGAIWPLAQTLNVYDLDENLNGPEALAAIEAAIIKHAEDQASEAAAYIDPAERLAAAQEAANLANGMAVGDAVITVNLAKGLWTASTLAKAVEVGAVEAAKAVALVAEANTELAAKGKAALDVTALTAVVAEPGISGATKG